MTSSGCPSGKAIDVTMIRLELWQCGDACARSYNSLLLFGHARREQLGLCKRACVPSDVFFTQGTWQGSHVV